MKIALIGSRGIKTNLNLRKYLPSSIDLLISGGACGIDKLAEKYADRHKIKKAIYKPNYRLFGSRAPLVRNYTIISQADKVVAIWDGRSSGTAYAIRKAKELNKPLKVYLS